MANKSSRQIIREKAKTLGWKRLPSRLVLTDRFGKEHKTLDIEYSIVGRCLRGTFDNGQASIKCTNRKAILECLKSDVRVNSDIAHTMLSDGRKVLRGSEEEAQHKFGTKNERH